MIAVEQNTANIEEQTKLFVVVGKYSAVEVYT
jgi:hypothetical protein